MIFERSLIGMVIEIILCFSYNNVVWCYKCIVMSCQETLVTMKEEMHYYCVRVCVQSGDFRGMAAFYIKIEETS